MQQEACRNGDRRQGANVPDAVFQNVADADVVGWCVAGVINGDGESHHGIYDRPHGLADVEQRLDHFDVGIVGQAAAGEIETGVIDQQVAVGIFGIVGHSAHYLHDDTVVRIAHAVRQVDNRAEIKGNPVIQTVGYLEIVEHRCARQRSGNISAHRGDCGANRFDEAHTGGRHRHQVGHNSIVYGAFRNHNGEFISDGFTDGQIG